MVQINLVTNTAPNIPISQLILPAPEGVGVLGVGEGFPTESVCWADREADAEAGEAGDGVGRGLLSAKSNTRITASYRSPDAQAL